VHTVYLVSVYLHIVAVIVWLGGAAFLALVVVPVVRRGELGPLAGTLIQQAGLRFRTVGWVCLSVILVTGLFNLHQRGLLERVLDADFYRSRYGLLVAYKLALMGLVLGLSALHDFWLGPRAGELMQSAPAAAQTARLRRAASWFGRVNGLLGLLLALVGVLLVRGC